MPGVTESRFDEATHRDCPGSDATATDWCDPTPHATLRRHSCRLAARTDENAGMKLVLMAPT
jgi:hypothetical protein